MAQNAPQAPGPGCGDFAYLTLSVLHTFLTFIPPGCVLTFFALQQQARRVLGHWPPVNGEWNPWIIRDLTFVQAADTSLVWMLLTWPVWAVLTLVLFFLTTKLGRRDLWLWVRIAIVVLCWVIYYAEPTGLFGWTWD